MFKLYRKSAAKCTLFYILLLVSSVIPSTSAIEWFTVNSPTSDTIWYRGDTVTINWTTSCTSDPALIIWSVDYTPESGVSYSIVIMRINVSNTGGYIWTIPLDFGDEYFEDAGDSKRFSVTIYCEFIGEFEIPTYIGGSGQFEIRNRSASGIIGYSSLIIIASIVVSAAGLIMYILKSGRLRDSSRPGQKTI